ncbi:AAA family ATPase [Hymenobacter sp. NST-14]|nr:AAA family ATPase [Hymenobacter piscis]
MKINAVAGSGKTTTVVEYARRQPAAARILYLAFNRTVKLEAQRKFAAAGVSNVQVETAHSLAFGYVVKGSKYRLHKTGYRAYELVELLELPKGTGAERNQEYVLASHINKYVAYFCNMPARKVTDLDYLSTVADAKAREFVREHLPTITTFTRQMLAMMERAEIEITHDFYLKKFQLLEVQLPHHYILFDEGQDASGVMLDVFLKQQATKILVGDAHQQIYGWRFAVNSLEKADFAALQLSTSFRFGNSIAALASRVLSWKTELGETQPLQVLGASRAPERSQTKAVIGRTNLALLLKAIEYLTAHRNSLKALYFEGNINSYTYADEGASLYDVLSLYNGRTEGIRDPLIRRMKSLDELSEYAEQTEDAQLLMMIQIVEEYGNQVISLIEELKRRHVADGARDEAQLYFSTVHRCKGLEYDQVQLTPDFITQSKLNKYIEQFEFEEPTATERGKVMEEINLLYVALTRARHRLHLPVDSLPAGFVLGPEISLSYGTGGTVLLPSPTPAAAVDAPLGKTVVSSSPRQEIPAEQALHARLAKLQERLDKDSLF